MMHVRTCAAIVVFVLASASLALDLELENDHHLRLLSGRRGLASRPGPQVGGVYWFEQNLDHFSPSDSRTWKQRYVVNDTYWTPGKGQPVFIFLAGEAPEDFFWFQEASALHWAQQYGALYVVLEHRYYGESLPFSRFSTANMTYLSSQQALADAAVFIDSYNKTLDTPGPWVVFGCSYSGALSAWLRKGYPNSVVASVAPSGPVHAESNYTGYFGLFDKSAADQPGCVDAVKQGVAQIAQDLSTSDGRSKLSSQFKSCRPITEDNAWYFQFTLMEQVGGSDQMDNPPDWPLNATCAAMTATSDPVANWASLFQTDACNPFDPESYADIVKLEVPNSNRAWLWQKCTEFGYFKPSYPGTSIFWGTIPLEKLTPICEQAFGIKGMMPNTEFTNTYYGGYDLLATNVMFSNGDKDPWSLLSIREDVPPPSQVQAVTYSLGHCATMIAPTPQDPPSLTQARKDIDTFLGQVLAEASRAK
eukprot:TRINITY_DN9366_c0_g1_i2.p1 TRINITY_DN9366_c0_g1~~TRINITY_DN9366_c0_g1_i2.p1  ORF type:complete len:490 (-),score=109.07 TRINITY_DN9366_c0_g1_i2:90-1517(-)